MLNPSPPSASPTIPRVFALTLYRSGVAYVERGGAPGGTYSFPVQTRHVDDLIASVTTRGPVRGLTFESRADPSSELAARRLNLDPARVLRDLIVSKLRGHEVNLRMQDHSLHRGRVVGLDSEVRESNFNGSTVPTVVEYVVLLDDGDIARVPLVQIQTLTPQDPALQADLEFYLNAIGTDDRTRSLTVQVDPNAPDPRVEMRYLAPAAVWRIKYDLHVHPTDGTAQLVPWAVAHNPLDEALVGIQLRFTTGRPTTFVTKIHEPQQAERAVLREDFRVSAPTQYAAGRGELESASRRVAPQSMLRSAPFEAVAATLSSADEDEERGDLAESAPQAEVQNAGQESEFVLQGVDLPPGQAVTLPLARVDYSAEVLRVWREGTAGAHPEKAVRLYGNATMTLEKGSVALCVGAQFVGQAVVPYTPRGAEIYLAYARDPGLTVAVRREGLRSGRAQVTAQGALVVVSNSSQYQIVVDTGSAHTEPVRVMVEITRAANCVPQIPTENAPYEVLEPTPTHWRFRVEVLPGSTQIQIPVDRADRTEYRVENLNDDLIVGWFQTGAVQSEPLRKALEHLAERARAVSEAQRKVRELRTSLHDMGERENSLISKLKELGTAAPGVAQSYQETLTGTVARSKELLAQEAAVQSALTQARADCLAAQEQFRQSLSS